MNQNTPQDASMPNPALKRFSVLIGNWTTTGTHGLIPDTTLHGHVSFEWLENGAFILMRSSMDDPRIPSAIAIFGSDDAVDEYYMLTSDVRGISRKYNVTLYGNTWKWWRNAPKFSQRYEGIISDDGNMIETRGELSKDDSTWEKDLNLTYKRVE